MKYDATREMWDPNTLEHKIDGKGNTILDGKGKPKNTEAGSKRISTGKNNLEKFRSKLVDAGMVDKSGNLIADIDPEKAKQIMTDMLSATDDNSFDTAYAFRRLFRPQKKKQAELILDKLIAQQIEYAELQGNPDNISNKLLLELFANDQLQAWFLHMAKGSDRLTTGTSELTADDKARIAKLGDGRTIGLDFAGAETKRFTDGGMGRWKNFYKAISAKAQENFGKYVLRTHVAEGAVERDSNGIPKKDSKHRDIANHNAGKLVDTLAGMDERGEFADNVVVRLGHMTHSDFEQLGRLDSISKEHGVIVEANLTSNLRTGTVRDKNEMHRVLLKFLYQDNLRVTLNTDGGGVMKTTIEREYEEAEVAIDRFESGELPLIDEKEKIMYYYDEAQVPDLDDLDDDDRDYKHVAIPKSKQKNYNIERLSKESDRYIDDIAPTIGSKAQRSENLASVNRHEQKNQNGTNEETEQTKKRKNEDDQKASEKR